MNDELREIHARTSGKCHICYKQLPLKNYAVASRSRVFAAMTALSGSARHWALVGRDTPEEGANLLGTQT